MTKYKDLDSEVKFTADDISDGTRPLRRIHPLGMRVLVKLKKADERSDGGLYLPDNAKSKGEESVLAKVIQVASALDEETDEETNISGIPPHAIVLIGRDAGTKVPWDDTLRVVDTKEVIALVEEQELI